MTTRSTRYRFAGNTALITGAASGIGEQLAHGLADRNSNLVLLDRDADGLDAVAARIRRRHPDLTVDPRTVDLVDRDATRVAAEDIARDHPGLTLLVNNAGVALGGRFDQLRLDEFEWVMDINFHAPVLLTHALLPTLKRHPGAHVVNVSSLFGLIAPAGNSAYSASKFALRGFSQALRVELAENGIGVTTVHPGGIRTRVASSARVGVDVPTAEFDRDRAALSKLLTYPPEKAAEEIIDAVHRRTPRLLIAWSARIPDLLARLLPAGHATVVNWLATAGRRR